MMPQRMYALSRTPKFGVAVPVMGDDDSFVVWLVRTCLLSQKVTRVKRIPQSMVHSSKVKSTTITKAGHC
jgi:hypothetical protein